MNTQLRAVLFDMGGTLIYYPPPEQILDILNSEEAEATLRIPRNILLQVARDLLDRRAQSQKTSHEFFMFMECAWSLRRLGIGGSESVAGARALMKYVYDRYASGAYLYPGTRGAIAFLRENNYKMGIVSNTHFPGYFHVCDLKRFGIAEYFSFMLFSSDIGVRKPNALIYKEALRRLDAEPLHVVFVGDQMTKDVIVPTEMGMLGTVIDRQNRHLAISPPYTRITDLREIHLIFHPRT